MENFKSLRIIRLVLALVISFLGVFLLANLIIFIISQNKNENVKEDFFNPENFRIEKRTEFSNSEIVRIEKKDTIIYKDENDYLVISNLKSKKFVCSGSCSCEEDRRRSSLTLSRGVTYIFTALSSVFAFKKASDWYQKECVKEYMDVCSPSAIKSEVEDCKEEEKEATSEAVEPSKVVPVAEEEETDMRKLFDDEEFETLKKKRYQCEGGCFPFDFLQDRGHEKWELDLQKYADDYPCAELILNVEFEAKIEDEYWEGGDDVLRERARILFIRGPLSDHCLFKSAKPVWYLAKTETHPMCMSNKGDDVNDSVVCTEI